MLHVQVPVLDVELLHLERQASRMSLKPREGKSVVSRACAEHGAGGGKGHPQPRTPGRLSLTDTNDGQAWHGAHSEA